MSAARRFGHAALALLVAGAAYLPLEEFLLKWSFVGPRGYVFLRLGFEALLVAALAGLVAGRWVRGLARPSTPLDGPLLAFVLLAAGSLSLSGGSVLHGLVNLRVLLRYVAVYYLVVFLELQGEERRRLLWVVLVSAGLQGVLGILQHLQGGATGFWLPRGDAPSVAGVTRQLAAVGGGLERGAVLGTTDHSVAYALFLLIAGTLAWAAFLGDAVRTPRARAALVALVPLCGAGILFSYVRSCLIGFGLALGLVTVLERARPRVRRWLPRAAALLTLIGLGGVLLAGRGGANFVHEKETAVSPLASLQAIFTDEYLQTARSSRLWVLRDVGSEIVRTAGWLGLGPDEDHAKEALLRSGGASLHRLIAYRAFEDVYWVALLAYYGFLGLGAFVLVLARLVPSARRVRRGTRDPWDRAAASALLALLVVLVPLTFLAPTFDFRTFSFYFWLLAGLCALPLRSAARPPVRPASAVAGALARGSPA